MLDFTSPNFLVSDRTMFLNRPALPVLQDDVPQWFEAYRSSVDLALLLDVGDKLIGPFGVLSSQPWPLFVELEVRCTGRPERIPNERRFSVGT